MKQVRTGKILAALGLAAALAASGVTALATGITFEAPQQKDAEAPMYLPESIPLKSMSLPLVTAEGGALLYVSPESGANASMGLSGDYPMRYLGVEGDYYHVLTFQNKEGYVKRSEASRSSRKVAYPVYPAGNYPVGRELSPGVETPSEDGMSVAYTPGIYRSNDEVALNANTGYYVKPLSGKRAKVTISTDPEGKEVVKTFSFKGSAIFDGENGQYITIENAVVYHGSLAPSALLKKYIAKNPQIYDPGEGRPADDPSLGFSTDDLLVVTFM